VFPIFGRESWVGIFFERTKNQFRSGRNKFWVLIAVGCVVDEVLDECVGFI
jgi:hypothetical protein